MKILCSHSGLEFNCEFFPGNLFSREASHPIFYLPQKKLLSYMGKWSAGGLTDIDSYLLFIAMLNSTDLVEFRMAIKRTEHTKAIIQTNIEPLARIITKINSISHPGILFAQYLIGPETCNLSTVHHWIHFWNENYNEFKANRGKDYETRKLAQREAALERLIRSSHRHVSTYSKQLADWALTVGSFPTYEVISPFNGSKIPMSEYWHTVIRMCASEERSMLIPVIDIIELYEYCQENIPIGLGVFSKELFDLLKDAIKKQQEFLNIGSDRNIRDHFKGNPKGSFTLLTNNDEDKVEKANIQAMIAMAPSTEPDRKNYPNGIEYLKAKNRWNMKMKYGSGNQNDGVQE